MSFVLFTLVAANLGLYFAFVSVIRVFPSMLSCALAALLLGPAACAGGFLASRKVPWLRLPFVLLPPLSLLLAPGIRQMLLLSPAILYPVMLLLAGRFTVRYWEYRNHVLWSSCVLFLLMVFSQTQAVRPLPVAFGTGSLVLSFFLLRQLRFGALTGPKQKCLELLSLCSIPAGVGCLTFLLTKTKPVVRWLTEHLFYPIGLLLQKLVDYVISQKLPFIPAEDPNLPSPTPGPDGDLVEAPGAIGSMSPSHEPIGDKVGLLLILIAAVFAVWLIVSCYRRLRDSYLYETAEEREDVRTEADSGIPRVPGVSERRSNRRKLRRIYEKYLKLLGQRHFHRQPQDSSQEIVEMTRRISAEEPAQALRELYIQARYQPDAAITGAQVRKARQLLRKLREDPEK